MAKIEVYGNQALFIEDEHRDPVGLRQAVSKTCSFAVKDAYFIKKALRAKGKNANWFTGQTKLLTERNFFPSGLIDSVVETIEKEGGAVTVERQDDPFTVPYDESCLRAINLHRKSPKDGKVHDYQVKAVRAILEQKRGVLELATNSGKTEIAIAAAKMFHHFTGKNVLFVTHRKQLASQTISRFHKEFDHVGFIGDGKWNGVSGATIAIVDTLAQKRGSTYDTAMHFLERHMEDGMIIVDECHHAPSDTWYGLIMACKAIYRIGMSGTPMRRADGSNIMLIASTGPVFRDPDNPKKPMRIRSKELIEWGFSVKPYILFDVIEGPAALPGNFDAQKKSGIIFHRDRNLRILEWVKAFHRNDLQTLILFWDILHGAELYRVLSQHFGEGDIAITTGSLVNSKKNPQKDIIRKKTGIDPDVIVYKTAEREAVKHRFCSRKLPIYLSSSIMDEGMDLDNIDAMILGGGGKSEIRTVQRIGRGLRYGGALDGLLLVDFADMHGDYLVKHSLERFNTMRKEGFDIFEGDDAKPEIVDDLVRRLRRVA